MQNILLDLLLFAHKPQDHIGIQLSQWNGIVYVWLDNIHPLDAHYVVTV